MTTTTPKPRRYCWRTIPDHLPVTREAVSLATGRALRFVEALENAVIHGGEESALCGGSGQWFEFLPGVQP